MLDNVSGVAEKAAKPTTIALVYASIGSGHKVAAQAVDEAFSDLYPTVQTHLIDVLEYGARKVDGDKLTRTFAGPTGPLYDAVWDNKMIGRLTWGLTGGLTRRFYADFTKHLDEINPDAVVCTHAMGANIAIGSRIHLAQTRLRESKLIKDVEEILPDGALTDPPKRDFPTIGIPTDYGVNASWPYAYLDLFCVGGPEIREDLLSWGVPPSNVAVTGIPTHKAFGEIASHADKVALRKELGLPENHHIALALAGASMPGPYVKFKAYLSHALPEMLAHEGVSVVVVTGKDSEYEEHLRSLAGTAGYENLHVYGYTKDMARLMSAADLLVCKPGGLTCTEGIRSGIPLLLVGHAMGQERVNVEFLGPRNISRHALNDHELVAEFDDLITNPSKLKAMKAATRAFRTPHSAEQVARHVMMVLEEERI